jgi:hypothetical protein
LREAITTRRRFLTTLSTILRISSRIFPCIIIHQNRLISLNIFLNTHVNEQYIKIIDLRKGFVVTIAHPFYESPAMKHYRLSILASLGLSILLSACGGDNVQIAMPGAASTAQASPADTQAAAPAYTAQVASASMPQPDCAADGCKGLRIIDANAESFRYQAMQQADAPQS